MKNAFIYLDLLGVLLKRNIERKGLELSMLLQNGLNNGIRSTCLIHLKKIVINVIFIYETGVHWVFPSILMLKYICSICTTGAAHRSVVSFKRTPCMHSRLFIRSKGICCSYQRMSGRSRIFKCKNKSHYEATPLFSLHFDFKKALQLCRLAFCIS